MLMINALIDDVEKCLRDELKFCIDYTSKKGIYILFYLKLQCDKKKLSYREIINKEKLDELEYDSEIKEFISSVNRTKINKLLAMIQYTNIKQSLTKRNHLLKPQICFV